MNRKRKFIVGITSAVATFTLLAVFVGHGHCHKGFNHHDGYGCGGHGYYHCAPAPPPSGNPPAVQ